MPTYAIISHVHHPGEPARVSVYVPTEIALSLDVPMSPGPHTYPSIGRALTDLEARGLPLDQAIRACTITDIDAVAPWSAWTASIGIGPNTRIIGQYGTRAEAEARLKQILGDTDAVWVEKYEGPISARPIPGITATGDDS